MLTVTSTITNLKYFDEILNQTNASSKILDVSNDTSWISMRLCKNYLYNNVSAYTIKNCYTIEGKIRAHLNKVKVQFHEGDRYLNDLPNEQYDLISLYRVIEQIPLDDVKYKLDKISRMTDHIVVCCDLNDHLWDPDIFNFLVITGKEVDYKECGDCIIASWSTK